MCEKQFIAFDLETTGLDAEDDRIIEIAAVKFVDCKATESFATLVNCGMPIPEDASAVNNITDDDVEDAPDEAAALKQFADFLGDDALKGKIPLVAHNAAFDSSFLKTAFRRCEITTRMKFADTLALSQRRLPKLENHKLQTVAQALDIQQQQAHRAEDDARVCGEVMAALLTKWIGEERERFNALLPEEQAACLWIYKTLKRQRCNIDHLSFSPSAYLTVNCWHKVLRIKIRAKTPYILVDDTITLPEGTVTAPATQTDGSGLIRVLYNNLEDLDWLQSWIATVYKKVSEETAAAWKVPKTQKTYKQWKMHKYASLCESPLSSRARQQVLQGAVTGVLKGGKQHHHPCARQQRLPPQILLRPGACRHPDRGQGNGVYTLVLNFCRDRKGVLINKGA